MIRTERLHIVPFSYEQLVSRVYSFSGMITNEEEQSNFIKYSLNPMRDAPEKDHKWYTSWAAYFEGEEVLECGYICPPTEHNVVEVWCYTKPEFQRQGFGTEAIKGLVRFATAFKEVHHVCASVAKGNIASQKMLENNGFYFLQEMNNGMLCYNKQLNN